MAVIGLGTDIVQINRLSDAGERLAKRILTATELEQWLQHSQPHRFLAKRFAAKEAAAKALGTGIAQGVSFQDFTIENDAAGCPHLTLSGKAAEIAASRGVDHWLISISDERDYAVATVIGEQLAINT